MSSIIAIRSIAGISVAVACALLGASPAVSQDDAEPVASVITRLHLQEDSQPVRERAQWRAPRKVVLLEFSEAGWPPREAFAAAAPGAQIIVARDLAAAAGALVDADVVVGFNPEICKPQLVDSARQLRWIASLAAGVERCVTVPSIMSRQLLLTNMRGVDSAVIAEHAIALTLALAHGLDTFAVDTSKATWSAEHGATTRIQTLNGKTMLVVGLGGIGTEVAMRAHALGMNVVATRDSNRNKPDFVSYVGLPDELLTLTKAADVVLNSVPLTPQTTGLYNATFFAAMKPSALFINIARGGSVVTSDLTAALNEHRIAGAGLDVADPEPLPPENPLWRAPHVLITPHISGRSDLPSSARWILAVENLRRYAKGEKMLSVVDLTKGY